MLEAGKPWRISPRVRRLVAPNPGPMTGPGTNTYLLGDEDVVVLDPGPAIDAHVEAILAAGEGRIGTIICTHTHPDHSPAWQAVARATGATVIGALPAGDDHQDETFQPGYRTQRRLRAGDVRAQAAGRAYAGACVQPLLFPAGGGGPALRRRPHHERQHGRDHSARRRHAGLHRVAGAPARGARAGRRTRPRRSDRGQRGGDPPPRRAPSRSRAQGCRGARRLCAGRPGHAGRRRCTTMWILRCIPGRACPWRRT
jgi:hypothetical protein